jgi:hypothetical protein
MRLGKCIALCLSLQMEHPVGETRMYINIKGTHHVVTRRDTKTADILLPNGRTCLGTFVEGGVKRDPIPFHSGRPVLLKMA